MKTLVIEDDPQTALYVTEGLRTHGHTVCWAPTGTDGFEQARAGDCALIIVDRMLPGLDGLTLVKSLRDINVQSPVLFLTTMDSLDARVEGLNAGRLKTERKKKNPKPSRNTLKGLGQNFTSNWLV